jgi:hypothetical protein
MLTTIEEKLSAIKAINEEKDLIDKELTFIIAITESKFHYNGILFCCTNSEGHLEVEQSEPFDLPTHVILKCLHEIKSYYESRQQTLIESAEQLMK